jgi:predicted negative regulator of RcsB-dependent stress response
MLIVIAVLLGYLGYRYWQNKKAAAFQPTIATTAPTDFTTNRDNPQGGQ